MKKSQHNTPIAASEWFESGSRLSWMNGEISKELVSGSLRVWNKVLANENSSSDQEWLSMMPGFPDGSFGWAQTSKRLNALKLGPQLYIEYVGQGDSDKPEGYPYGTKERADLVEALWRYHNIISTRLITFDYSSIVAMELLSRYIDRVNAGEKPFTRITGFLSFNGGLFADAHTHPFLTTPLLKTYFGRKGAQMAQNSFFFFKQMMKDLWSKEYKLTNQELMEVHNAIARRNGTVFMSNAAKFVDEHKQNAARWDFKRIYQRLHPDVDFLVAGSKKDQFEHKQVVKARERLGSHGLVTKVLPGGHMTTSEHPDLLANLISDFAIN